MVVKNAPRRSFLKVISIISGVQKLPESQTISKIEVNSSNDLLMMTSPHKQTTNGHLPNNHQSTNSLQTTSGAAPFYTTITISPGTEYLLTFCSLIL